jgi:hypothetical protein
MRPEETVSFFVCVCRRDINLSVHVDDAVNALQAHSMSTVFPFAV